MNNEPTQQRIDEIGKYYDPISRMNKATEILFWLIASISLFMPYAATVLGNTAHDTANYVFLVLTLIYFILSQFSRFYLVPKAERMRRKQLLSDAFGTRLIHERTSLYYNNDYSSSVKRLGANTLENALFSKEIAATMLVSKRWTVGIYVVLWVLAFALRHNSLQLLTWITQVVFSGRVFAGWLTLESLRFRHERTFDQLHAHFLHDIGDDVPRAIADVIDAFVEYESTKSSAGILLSSKVFNQLNSEISKKWEQIKMDLKIGLQQDASLENDTAMLYPNN